MWNELNRRMPITNAHPPSEMTSNNWRSEHWNRPLNHKLYCLAQIRIIFFSIPRFSVNFILSLSCMINRKILTVPYHFYCICSWVSSRITHWHPAKRIRLVRCHTTQYSSIDRTNDKKSGDSWHTWSCMPGKSLVTHNDHVHLILIEMCFRSI